MICDCGTAMKNNICPLCNTEIYHRDRWTKDTDLKKKEGKYINLEKDLHLARYSYYRGCRK